MLKSDFIGFRATDAERERLTLLSSQTGMKMSEVLRSLVQSAVVEPVTTYRVVAKKNSAHGVLTTTSADVSVRS